MDFLEKLRKRYPEYNDMSDKELAGKYAEKFPHRKKDLEKYLSEETTDLKDVKDLVGCVVDSGYFISLARRISRDIKKTYYCTPTDKEFLSINDYSIGEGFPEIEKIDGYEFMRPELLKEIDFFVFPDIGYAPIQNYLRSIGKPVFGSFDATELEIYRTKFLKELERLNLPVSPYKICKGLTELRDHLKTVKNKYIKVDLFRREMETWHHIDYAHSEDYLNHLGVVFGGAKETVVFIVQDEIKSEQETGGDLWTIKGKYPSKYFQGYEKKNECYDKETEVLTNEGWKFFKNLNGKEKFLTLNIFDKRHYRIEYQEAIAHTQYQHTGKMLSIESKQVSLLVTPGHKLLVQVDSQNHNAPIVNWKNMKGESKTFHLGKKERKLVEAQNLNLNKAFSMPFPRSAQIIADSQRRTIFKFGDIKIEKLPFAEFMGFYLSEGYTDGKRILISQKKYKGKVEKTIKNCGLKYYKCKGKDGTINFGISNRPLAKYLLEFGKSAEKFIPDWIKLAGKELIQKFLMCYCLGDGSFLKTEKLTRGKRINRVSFRITTISFKMANDIQELYIKTGMPAFIAYEPITKTYKITAHSTKSKNIIFPKHTQWIDYSDKVYCVTVPNQTLMVRRNGKPIWSGNCYISSLLSASEMPEPVKEINEKLAPVFKKYGYQNFFATEIRVKGKLNFFIDPTLRIPGMSGEQILENCKNLTKVIWYGANGEFIEPEFEFKYAVTASAYYCGEGSKEGWSIVKVPKETERWIKFSHCCLIDGYYRFPSEEAEDLGVVMGLGNTLLDAFKMLKKNIDSLKNEPVEFKLKGYFDLLKSIRDAESKGIKFSNDEIPTDEEVLKIIE